MAPAWLQPGSVAPQQATQHAWGCIRHRGRRRLHYGLNRWVQGILYVQHLPASAQRLGRSSATNRLASGWRGNRTTASGTAGAPGSRAGDRAHPHGRHRGALAQRPTPQLRHARGHALRLGADVQQQGILCLQRREGDGTPGRASRGRSVKGGRQVAGLSQCWGLGHRQRCLSWAREKQQQWAGKVSSDQRIPEEQHALRISAFPSGRCGLERSSCIGALRAALHTHLQRLKRLLRLQHAGVAAVGCIPGRKRGQA